MTTKQVATTLFDQGIRCLPIVGGRDKSGEYQKNPACKQWKHFNTENYKRDTINDLFSVNHKALSVMGGYVSTGLEILDVDLKNARDPKRLWIDLMTNIEAALPDFAKNCTIAKTPSGGYHLYYSCFEVGRNVKLASEIDETTGGSKDVIETRGDGGYALTWPSEGYEIIQGSIHKFAYTLSPQERDDLFVICRIFDEQVDDMEMPKVKRFVPRGINFIRNPFEDYNRKVTWEDIQALIFKAGFEKPIKRGHKIFFKRTGSDNPQGGNWHEGKGVFYPFTGNSRLDSGRAYSPATMLRLLEFNGDGKECYKWLISSGYGERIKPEDEPYIHQAYEGLKEGRDRDEIRSDQAKKNIDKERVEKYIEIAENRLIRMSVFWEEDDKGKVSVDIVELKDFLEDNGFKKYRKNSDDAGSILVLIDSDNHRIKEIDIEYVKDFLQNYLKDDSLAIPVKIQKDVLRALMNKNAVFFKETMFEWLDVVTEGEEIKTVVDTKFESYFFFRSSYVKITRSKPEILSYDKLDEDQYVWENSIKDFDISLVDMNKGENINRSEYYRFVKRLVGLGVETDKMDMNQLDEIFPDNAQKLKAFMTTTGFLCHRHNDRKRSYSVIVAEDILDSSEGGGTGKGIYLSSLSKVRNAVFESGKTWEPSGDFAFQKWKPGTNLYLIDDVTRKFDFESLYSFITDFGSITKKYQSSITLPFEAMPKIVLTTNYGDMADGANHGERRRKMLLVGKYYGAHMSPYDEFGHNLFDDWDSDQWNLFYNFIFHCIQQFLEGDLVDFPSSNNVKMKTFLQRYGGEIYDFFGELSARSWPVPIMLDDLVNEFHEVYKRKKFSSQAFLIALQKFCDMRGFELEKTEGTNTYNHHKRLLRILTLDESGQKDEKIEETRDVSNLPF